jgi:hypothetical protein
MGQINTEQAVEIIEAVTATVDAATPNEVTTVIPPSEPNYWWLLLLAVIPVLLTFFLQRRKALPKKGKK